MFVVNVKLTMKYQKIILVTLLLPHLGCSVTKLQERGNVKPKYFYSKIEFETYQSVIAFDVDIDGQTKKFLFDTGADLSLVQRDTLKGRASKYSGASKRKMKLGREVVPLIRIGNTKFTDTYALNGDLVGLKEQIPNFGGLIGQPIIKKSNWLINYPGKKIEISNANLVGESFKEIEIIRKDGSPFTFIEMSGEKYQVMIDFGSSSTLNLPEGSKFAEDVAKIVELSENTRDRYTLGGLQKTQEKVGVIPEIRLGEFVFENVDVNINPSSQPRIGISFFKDYFIYIDNANGGVFKLKKSAAQ